MPQRLRNFGKFVKNRTLLCLILAALQPAVAFAQTSRNGALHLPWDQWQMHIGDDPRCAAPHDPGCVTQRYFVDINRYGIEWQRIEITLPSDLRHPGEQLGLLIQGEEPVYEVFVNGQFIGGSGSFRTHQGRQDSRTVLKIPIDLASDGPMVIAIRELSLHTSLPAQGFAPAIGPFDQTQRVMDEDTLTYLRSSWQHYVCFGAMSCCGLMFFLLFSVNTRLREYFWLGALLFLLFLFRLGELATVLDLGMPSWVWIVTYNLGNSVQTLIIIEFVFSFLGRPVPRFFRFVEICGAFFVLNLLLLVPSFYTALFPLIHVAEPVMLHSFGAAIFIALLAQLLLIPMCLRSKLTEMRWIGGAILFLTVVEARWQAGWVLSLGFPEYLHWGALDFDVRPVAWLLFAIVMLVAMTFRLRRIQDRNRQVEQEIAAARSVQQILIPDQLPSIPGLRIESAYLPAQEVGGDFFQILPIPNADDPRRPSAFIVLGDVSGKGLKAAMTVSMIVGTLRAFAESYRSPGDLLGGLNRLLHNRGDGFATCLALLVEPSGKITLANAAHLNPYINGSEIQTEPNLPLGLSLDVSYAEITLHLESGQACTLITDGVVEAARASSRELFGFDRTQAISTRSASDIAEAARVFGIGAPQADDITVLTIARTSVAQPALA